MHSTLLFNRIKNLTGHDEVSRVFRSLRQNSLVWSGLEQVLGDEKKYEVFLNEKRALRPANLVLSILSSDSKLIDYPGQNLPANLLEKSMMNFEKYLQEKMPVDTFEGASLLALAILEKHKITGRWKPVLLEISSNMNINNGETLLHWWGTPLVIAQDFIENKDELYTDLHALPHSEVGMELFLHLVFCDNTDLEVKESTLRKFLSFQSVTYQSKALRIMKTTYDSDFATRLARGILDIYSGIDLNSYDASVYWTDPENAISAANRCMHTAEIAEIAGEPELAVRISAKADEVFSALHSAARNKGQSLARKYQTIFPTTQQECSPMQNEALLENEEMGLNTTSDIAANTDDQNPPLDLLDQAIHNHDLGNLELAYEQSRVAIQNLSQEQLIKLFSPAEGFANPLNPVKTLRIFVDAGLFTEVLMVTSFLLKQNPGHEELNAIAAESAEGLGQFDNALEHYQTLAMLNQDSLEINRNLARINLTCGNIDDAYQIAKQIMKEEDDNTVSDLTIFVETALRANQLEDARSGLNRLSKLNPLNADYFTLAGRYHHQAGENDKALEHFQKAVDLDGSDAQAWIKLSDVLWETGEKEKSILVIKQARVASPGNQQIELEFAKKLVFTNSKAEAFPILKSISNSTSNSEIDGLFIRVMKELGHPDLEEALENLYTKHPNCFNIAMEYAKFLSEKGEIKKSLGVYELFQNQVMSDPESCIEYYDIKFGNRYEGLDVEIPDSILGENEASILKKFSGEQVLGNRIKILEAESFLKRGANEKAFISFSELLESQNIETSIHIERIQSGLALAASRLGKLDVAMAAIQNAIASKPGWIGLKRILAEVLEVSGQVSEALEQARLILDCVPNVIENIVWFIRIVQRLGNYDEAEKALVAATQEMPDRIELQIELINLYERLDKQIELEELLSRNKQKIAGLSDSTDLFSLAMVFDRNNDFDTVQECLTKAVERKSDFTNLLNLAGFYRSHKNYVVAQKLFASIEETQKNAFITQILKAENSFASGDLENSLRSIECLDSAEGMDMVINQTYFVPLVWQRLINSKSPLSLLKTSFLLKTGRIDDAINLCESWRMTGVDDSIQTIYSIECALAGGRLDLYEEVTASISDDHGSIESRQLKGLLIEREIDKGNDDLARNMLSEIDENQKDELIFRILNIRLVEREGDLAKAESQFDVILKDHSSLGEIDNAIQVGLDRNLVKASMCLNRWEEAIQISRNAAYANPYNQELIALFAEVLAKSLIYDRKAIVLGVRQHKPWSNASVDNHKEELDWITNRIEKNFQQDQDRWVLQAKLAIDPSQENIRELALQTPTPDVAAALMFALRNTGQVKTAIQVSKKFIENAIVKMALAFCLSEIDPNAAIDTLSSLLNQNPSQPIALRFRSQLLETMGKKEESIRDLQEALHYWPNEINWRLAESRLWTSLGNIEKALMQLEYAHEISPDDLDVSFELGSAYVAIGNSTNALELLEKSILQDPNRSEIWEKIAEAHYQTGNYEPALNAAAKAGECDPFAVKPHLLTGRISLSTGNYEQALEQTNLAIERNPSDAETYVFLASVFKMMEESGKALAALEQASRCKNATVQTMIAHVTLLKEINGSTSAKTLLENLVKEYPENPTLLKMLAEIHQECGESNQAESIARKALEIHPEEADIHLLIGKIQEESGNLDQAAHSFSQVVTYAPTNIQGYLNLSETFVRQREYVKARNVLEEGIKRAPTDSRMYLAYAGILKAAKDYTGAEQILRQASVVNPQDLNIRRQLGAVLALNLVHQSQEVSAQI